MKFRVTMKDPDCLSDCAEEAARDSLESLDLSDDEKQVLLDARADKLCSFAKSWMEYGEYMTVEFDTEAGTATVVRRT